MKKSLVLLLFVSTAGLLYAQTSRLTVLQGARNLVITTSDKQSQYYIVTSERSQMLFPKNGQLVIGRDTFPTQGLSMRLKAMPRFALDEDSTLLEGKYAVDNGLLAFRRSMNIGKWNSIIVPVSLTGSQIREAFGDDAQLASVKGVSDGAEATLEFQLENLDTDDVVLKKGVYYLIKPTREPDIPVGSQTSAVYGTGKVAGPVYVIPGVSLASGQSAPGFQTARSESDNIRIRFRGTYVARDGARKVVPTSRTLYALNDEGRFLQLVDSTTVKAFRSWIEDASKISDVKVRFVIAGIEEDLSETTGIKAVEHSPFTDRNSVYDIHGRKVMSGDLSGRKLSKGIYIVNGRKVIIR